MTFSWAPEVDVVVVGGFDYFLILTDSAGFHICPGFISGLSHVVSIKHIQESPQIFSVCVRERSTGASGRVPPRAGSSPGWFPPELDPPRAGSPPSWFLPSWFLPSWFLPELLMKGEFVRESPGAEKLQHHASVEGEIA